MRLLTKRAQLTKQVWVQMEVGSDADVDAESHKAIVACERTDTSIKMETTQIATAAVAQARNIQSDLGTWMCRCRCKSKTAR